MVRGLIFDVDGTLVSLKVDVEKLRSTTTRELVRMGFDISFMDGTSLHTQEIIDRAREQVESGSVKIKFELFRAALNAALDEVEMDWNALAQPIPGTTELLDRLRAKDVRLATLTNSGRAPSEWLLKQHDLLRRFDFTLSRDDVSKLKPSPDGVLEAVEMMGLPKEEVVYVGDSVIDVKAAKAAGVKVASVTTGRYSHERLRNEGSDYIMDSLSELLDLV
ncbi:MAG: HAD family hydrolase [Thaumarchaeota archaeon]|nr:HAD family hydrolase [Nitrososphaerota archaeon]